MCGWRVFSPFPCFDSCPCAVARCEIAPPNQFVWMVAVSLCVYGCSSMISWLSQIDFGEKSWHGSWLKAQPLKFWSFFLMLAIYCEYDTYTFLFNHESFVKYCGGAHSVRFLFIAPRAMVYVSSGSLWNMNDSIAFHSFAQLKVFLPVCGMENLSVISQHSTVMSLRRLSGTDLWSTWHLNVLFWGRCCCFCQVPQHVSIWFRCILRTR